MANVETFFIYANDVNNWSLLCERSYAKKVIFEAIEREKEFYVDSVDGRDWIRYTFESNADIILIETVKIDGKEEWFIQPYNGEIIDSDLLLIQDSINKLVKPEKLYSDVIINVFKRAFIYTNFL